MTAGREGARLPAVLVPHGSRSIPVLQLVAAAAGICRPVWLVRPSDPEARAARRLLERFGPVVEVEGRTGDELAAALEEHEPSGAVAFRDEDLVLVAVLASRLGLRFHSPAVARRLADKLEQRHALRAAGVAVPRTTEIADPGDPALLDAAAHAVTFPAVVKPRRGSGSRHTFLVHGPAELAAALASCSGPAGRAEPVVVEDYLPSAPGAGEGRFADYVSVETLATSTGLVHVAVTGRTHPVAPFRETGLFVPSDLDAAGTEAVLATATAALEALGVTTGCAHTEIKLTPAGPRVIEVNGRMGGGVRELLLAAAGRDLLADHLRSCLGEPVGLDGLLPCDRIGYRLFYQPPLAARRLVAIEGLRELATHPDVEDVAPHLSPGDCFDPREGTRTFLFSVVGAVEDHEGVVRASRRIYERTTVRYETDTDLLGA